MGEVVKSPRHMAGAFSGQSEEARIKRRTVNMLDIGSEGADDMDD